MAKQGIRSCSTTRPNSPVREERTGEDVFAGGKEAFLRAWRTRPTVEEVMSWASYYKVKVALAEQGVPLED